MTTSEAVETFWMQLAESGLIPEPRVRQLAQASAREGIVSDIAAAKKLIQVGLLTRYQARRLLEGRSRGFFFDHYKLLDLLGVGGMGWVYRATNIQTGEIVALKVLLDHLKNDQGMLARFEQEARAGLRLQHENIVRTLEYGSAGGLPYVIMEFVEGPSLLELLRLRDQSRLPYEQACEIARQAALGLQHVHRAGLVHRDIKPQNLLVDHDCHVKILDFGLTMVRDGEGGDEFSMAMIFGHECVGTAAYTAPEQASDSLKADGRSDIYSLGCTLYASLIGDTPFPLDNPNDVLNAHQTRTPRNVCEIVRSIPQPVGDIVAKMLEKKPEDRFSSAAEVASALAVWSRSAPVEFDFAGILAERNKNAREKMEELHQRPRHVSGAASSTARPATISSVANAADMKFARGNDRSLSSASSVARRNPFGFEHPPAILLRKTGDPNSSDDSKLSSAAKSGMMLMPLNGGEPVPLTKNRFVIGRRADCDLQIHDAAVSSRHCELVYDDSQWALVDLNSRNGVRLNGEVVVRKHPLRPGDTIIVGTLRLRLCEARRELPAKPSKPPRRVWLMVIAISLVITLIGAGCWLWRFGL